MIEKAVFNLYNLEEEIEEDTTPFITGLRLEEALGHLPKLEELEDEQSEIYEKTEPSRVRIIERQETVEIDKEGNIRQKTVIPVRSLVHEEKLGKIEKNPDLICLCSIGRSKIYYNQVKDEFWRLNLKPVWVRHRRTMQIESWEKLQPHDFETMLALGILYHRDFHNPIYPQIWIRKRVRKKMRKIIDKFEGEKNS